MTRIDSYSRASAQKAIEHHYDIGNEFYALWLDDSMSYSCAMWPTEERHGGLEHAQLQKLDYHISESRAAQSMRVLDIGCGWGGLFKRLIQKNTGLKSAVGLTLSSQQLSYVQAMNLPNVEVRLENWLDHYPDAPYDAMVSIGAFEHFSSPSDSEKERRLKYRKFFEFTKNNLVKNGRLSLQTIAYLNMERDDASEFMKNEIFPNSELPTLTDIIESASGIMEILHLRNDRLDYVNTCEKWGKRLKANKDLAIEMVGIDLFNRYERYLKMSSLGFFMGKICLLRLTLQRA